MERTYTHIGARTRRCCATGSQTPGVAGPATPTSGSWEQEPSRDERYTWRVSVANCVRLIGKSQVWETKRSASIKREREKAGDTDDCWEREVSAAT